MHPAGEDVSTVLVCVLVAWQAPHAEYVNALHVVGVGGGGGGGGAVVVVVGGGVGGFAPASTCVAPASW